MNNKSNLNHKKAGLVFTAAAVLVFLFNCAQNKFEDQTSFAPSVVKPQISGVSANGGGSLYCSISGGCPLIVTGQYFFEGAKVFVGPYECSNPVINSTNTQISCTVAAGKSGVFDVSVVNLDGKVSEFAASVSNTSALQFSYASFLYVGVQDSPGKVYGYAAHPVSGTLLAITGSPFTTGGGSAYGTVISPNNKFLYAANVASGTVAAFSINTTNGRLTLIGTPITSGGASPNGLFFHPSGNYLYVTNQTGNSVSAFSVDSSGLLTTVSGSPFPTTSATTINGIVTHPNGKFVYAASMGGSGGVVGFSVSQTTPGALDRIPGSPFKNTNGGFNNTGDGITIHPNGRWLYMGLTGQKRVAVFSIDENTGVLTGVGTPILNNSTTGYTDNGGSGANISPDGLYFYGTAFSTNAGDPKKVIIYSIDQTTGDLTRVSEADAGGGPNDVRVDTNGTFAYTCNSANSPSISAFSRNTGTGELVPLSPRDVSIPTANYGPGIMVIQK